MMNAKPSLSYLNFTMRKYQVPLYDNLILINMKLLKIFILILFTSCFFANTLIAQTPELKIGDIVPDTITFKGLVNYPVKNPKISDFKGKLVILDFWSTWCGTCIASMPQMEELQKKFKDRIQVILINSWQTKEEISERLRNWKNFSLGTLPRVDGDTSWRMLFPHYSLPHHVWIDEEGKVIAVTGSHNTNIENIRNTLEGRQPKMMVKKDLKVDGFDPRKGLFAKPHPSLVIPFQSGFVRMAHMGSGNTFLTDTVNNLYTRIWRNSGILSLYRSAYSFYYDGRVDIKTKHKSLFFRGGLTDDFLKNALYSYQITLPIREKENVNKYLITDLNDFFAFEKGIVGIIEPRNINSYVATLAKPKLLKSQGGKTNYALTSDTLTVVNTPLNLVFQNLQGDLEDLSKPFILINETDFTGNVDMFLTGDLHDFNNLRKQMASYGISLKQRKRKVDVLVIKDIN